MSWVFASNSNAKKILFFCFQTFHPLFWISLHAHMMRCTSLHFSLLFPVMQNSSAHKNLEKKNIVCIVYDAWRKHVVFNPSTFNWFKIAFAANLKLIILLPLESSHLASKFLFRCIWSCRLQKRAKNKSIKMMFSIRMSQRQKGWQINDSTMSNQYFELYNKINGKKLFPRKKADHNEEQTKTTTFFVSYILSTARDYNNFYVPIYWLRL